MAIDPKLLAEQENAIATARERSAAALEAINELQEKQKTVQDQLAESVQIELDLLNQKKEKEVADLELKKAQLEISGQTQQEIRQINEEISKINEEYRKQSKIGNERLKLAQKEDEKTAKIKQNVLGVVKAEEMRFTSISKTWEVSQKLNRADALATLASKLQETGFLIFGLAEQFNSVSAALNKTTNSAGKFDSAIANIASSNIRFGVSMEDAAKSIGTLYEEFNSFSSLSDSSQQDLAGFTAQMEKAGISSQTTAKFLNTATRSMGMGINEVKKYERELFAFSRANGISMKAINDGLASVMPRLAAFGKDAPKIFKDLAFQAKQMGVEMGKILDVTEKFTTFEGAAEAVGELNSVLGGNYLDSLEMLRAASDDPVKAQEMLRDALQKTGKSFDQLSGQQRRMFASMLGTDMDTAAGFFKKTTAEAKQAAMSQEQFNDAVAQFTPIADKMKNLISAMAPVIKVVASVFGAFVDLLAWFIESPLGTFLLSIVGALGALAAGVTALVGFFASAIGSIGLFLNILKGSGTIFQTVKNGVSNLGETVKNVAKSVSSGFKSVFKGIGEGFMAFGNAVKSLANPAVLKGILIAGAIAAVLFVIALGAKFVMQSMSSLIDVLVKSGSAIFQAAAGLAVFSLSLTLLAAGLALLGTIGLIGLAVLAGVTASIFIMGESFKNIGEGISKAESGISSLMSFDLTKLDTMKDKLSAIADVVERMGAAATIFSAAMSDPIMLPVMAATVAAAPALQTTAMTIGNTASATGDSNKQINVTVQIDSPIVLNDRELGRFVENKIIQMDTYGNMLGDMSLATTNKAPPK